MMISSNPQVPGSPDGVALSAGRRIAILLAPVLVLLALGCPGSGMSPEREVHLEAVPRKAVVTAGRDLPLGFVVVGSANRAVAWKVEEANGGTVTPAGLYTAPAKPGVYHVQVRSLEKPSAMDRTEITVHAAPQAVNLTAEPASIRLGATVTLTPVFQGGQGSLLPGNTPLTSGTAVSVTPVRDATYTLRVTNDLGVVDEKSAQVHVEHIQRVLHDIHGPEVVRMGSHYVAWVERRVGARLEWSSDDLVFLGDQANPTTQVVVFTPRGGRETFHLKVRAQGGTDLAGPGQPDTATYEFRGVVEPLTGDVPVIQLERPFLTAGKAGYRARVGNPAAGTRYTWTIQNGSFAAPDPEGPEVGFSAGQADYLLLTCTATVTATGASRSATAGAALLEPPSPPVLNAPGDTVAGLRHWAYVKTAKPLESYRWELDPAQGALDQDQASVAGPLASFKILQPGAFTLRCRAENLAGEVSEATALTLTAVGPFVLQEPQIVWPQFIHENSGPHDLEVVNRPPGLTYAWEVAGGTPASSEGPSLRFQAGAGPALVITCTARDSVTGATSKVSKAYQLQRLPAAPVPQGPALVAAGSTQVAGLAHGGRPGERYEWTISNGDLRPARAEDRGVAVAFEPRASGPYTLSVVAVNEAGDRSAPGSFTGTVAAAAGGGAAAGAPALAVSYHSRVFALGAGNIPDQDPTVVNALGTVTYALNGVLPHGLSFDPASGRISGEPDTPGPAQFRVAAAAANGTALSDTVVFLVNGSAGTSPDTALAVTYDSAEVPASLRMPDLAPRVRNAAGVASFALAWGALPRDVRLDAGTGVVWGNPSTPGTYLFRVEARDGSRTALSNVLGIVVNGPGGAAGARGGILELSYDSAQFPAGIPAIPVQSPRLRNAVGTTRFTVASGQLPPDLQLNSATGEIFGSPRAAGGLFQIAVQDDHGTALSNSIAYLVRGGGSSGGAFAVSYDPNTFTAGHPIPDQYPFVSNRPPGPLTFQVTMGQLPPDLHLDPGDGRIHGTPAAPGPSVFTITATHATAVATAASVTYMVNPLNALALGYTDNPPGLRSREAIPAQAANPTEVTPGSPVSYAWTGNLVPGLRLDPHSGEITGRPAQPGAYHFTVTARNWNRTSSANLTYTIAPGPRMALHYADLELDTRSANVALDPTLDRSALLQNDNRFELVPPSRLPAGLRLDPASGKIAGAPTEAGSFPFRVRQTNFDAGNPADPQAEAVESNLATCTVRPFATLALRGFGSDERVLDPGQTATLSWTYDGIPRSLRLSRNLLPTPTDPVPPEQNPVLCETIGTPGQFPGVAPTRRQTFTLRLEDRFGGAPLTGSVSLGARGMEAVAGNPRFAFPSLEYLDGPANAARLPEISGLACASGTLLAAEGSFHTIRKFDFAGSPPAWERFKGIPNGPDQGAAHRANQRLNHPGPMAVRREGGVDWIYVADTGSHTIKRMRADGSGDVELFAGVLGEAGGSNGPRTAALAALAPRLVRPARFGRIMDLQAHENFLYIADLDYGIRRLNFDDGRVTTLRPGAGGYRTDPNVQKPDGRTAPWPELRGPIALAVGTDTLDLHGHPLRDAAGHPIRGHRIYVVTEEPPHFPPPAAAGAPNPDRINFTIQVLLPMEGNDPHGNRTHWMLTRYAGESSGEADGGLVPPGRAGSVATFRHPVGLLLAGPDLLVVDDKANAVRRIDTSAREVSTLAGFKPSDARGASQVTSGWADNGTTNDGRMAKFKGPTRLVQGAAAGAFLLIDQDGTAIRQLVRSAAGVQVTTLVKQERKETGTLPATDRIGLREWIIRPPRQGQTAPDPQPPNTALPFVHPVGVVVERATGDVFVVGGNQTVRRVSLLGTASVPATAVSTFAGVEGGTGPGDTTLPVLQSRFTNPSEIGMDGLARQYVLENNGSRVRQIDQGVVHLFLRGGPAPAAGAAPDVDPLPYRRPRPGGPAPHLAVRPGGDAPQLLALSRRPQIPATPASRELDLPWRIDVCQVAPAQHSADFGTQFEPVELQFDHPTTGPAAQAMAFGQDSRLYVLFEDRARQVCEIHTYERPAGPFPQTWRRQGQPTEFGPGLPGICENWGFPRIHAMAADTRGNLYLTDSANAMVWLRRADTGAMVRLAGDPPVHRLRGEAQAQPFDQPLYWPTGIAVTAEDDLVILDGNSLVQLTAPGTHDHPWQPPLQVPWASQAEHAIGYVPPAGAGGGAGRGGRGRGGAGAGAGGGAGTGGGAGAPAATPRDLQRFTAARNAFNGTGGETQSFETARSRLQMFLRTAPATDPNRAAATRLLLDSLYQLGLRARAAGNNSQMMEYFRAYENAQPNPAATDAQATDVRNTLRPPARRP